jgi:hypothetical protein
MERVGKNSDRTEIRLLPYRGGAALIVVDMPVWPKSFYTFRVNLLTAATELKLRQSGGAVARQERVFRALIPRLAAARFWRESGIERGTSYETFQARVPLRTHEQLAPAIAQMKCGEADVLWPGRCALFAATAGTTGGQPKHLPITDEFLAHVRRAGGQALLYYTVRARHAGVMRGRHLLLSGSTELAPVPETKPEPAYVGELSGIAALTLPKWAERHLYEPGPAAGIADWRPRLDAIVARVRARDISLLAGLPTAVLSLAHLVRDACSNDKKRITHLQALWPNFECVMHSGTPHTPFQDELRSVLGPTVRFHEVYAATEGIIAIQDGEPVAGLRLLSDAGLFFEFIPLAEFDEARLDQLGSKAVPLAGVKVGTDYVVVLTTPGGLARYVLGDIVRFLATTPPRLVFVGNTRLQLNAFGERVQEKDVTDALVALCSRNKWTVVNCHVAPLFTASLTGQKHGRHEWWIELKPGTVATPTGPQMATELDTEMLRLNPEYAAHRKAGVLAPPFVRLVMPGVFEHWLRFHHQSGGQHKTPRCRSDRLVADELAQITNFARD